MFSSPWHAKTYEMYDAACRACEKPLAYQNSQRFASVLGARPQSTSGAQRTDHDDRHSTLSVAPRICVSSRPRRVGVLSSWKSSQQVFLPLVFASRCGIPPLTLWLATATTCSALTCGLSTSTFSLTRSTRCTLASGSQLTSIQKDW